MKKIILISLLIAVLVLSGCSNEQKINECIEACICVGNYEQPDRDTAEKKLACKWSCEYTSNLYETSKIVLDDLDTKTKKLVAKCNQYEGEKRYEKPKTMDEVMERHLTNKDFCSDFCKQECGYNGKPTVTTPPNYNYFECKCCGSTFTFNADTKKQMYSK